jgi:purine-nucleoside phosphorylase
VRERIGDRTPTVGLILGSGLGAFADRLQDAVAIEYNDIPHFPIATVSGHDGRLVIGEAPDGGPTCVVMQGRVHYYEGHSMARVVFATRAMITLGARTIIVTNAAGGLDPDWEPGTLMLIRDHINLLPEHPLRGPNDARIGPRFPDMTRAYAPALRELAHGVAAAQGVELAEGVYVSLSGPSYETPAEVRMLRTMGASAVGMSTVLETIALRQRGVRVGAISCITNLAAGVSDNALSHAEVTRAAQGAAARFQALLRHWVALTDGLETEETNG